MRDFKELLTGQGEDLFHKNMRKFGATVVESHQAFKDIKEGGNGGSADGGADEWIVAVVSDNANANPNAAMVVAMLGAPMFFPKGDALQIVAGKKDNIMYLSIITSAEAVINFYAEGGASSKSLVGAAIKRGATMNDVGDGKVRTFNNEEDYKNILLDVCLLSGYNVTMADVENSVKFLSQNELMAMMANYGA